MGDEWEMYTRCRWRNSVVDPSGQTECHEILKKIEHGCDTNCDLPQGKTPFGARKNCCRVYISATPTERVHRLTVCEERHVPKG